MARRDSRDEHVATAGAARSPAEIVAYVASVAPCPACGAKGLILQTIDRAPARPGVVAEAKAFCALCYAPSRHLFTAGPGWDAPPAEDDPRLATGEAPSTLLPESVFRRWADDAVRRLESTDPADGADLELHGKLGLQGLLELQKLRRAAGGTLDADDQERLRRCARAFVAGGGKLPKELDALGAG
jgi:hypothetical protein